MGKKTLGNYPIWLFFFSNPRRLPTFKGQTLCKRNYVRVLFSLLSSTSIEKLSKINYICYAILQDLPASNGVMQVSARWFSFCKLLIEKYRIDVLAITFTILKTIGRDKRMEYAASFQNCYFLRLLYLAGTQYPIMGAIR